MGKGQSKHGECYLVNAHFNPLCQLEDSNSLQSIETPLTSQDSGLQLTPEISFSLSEDEKSGSDKNATTKCALEVFLPQETIGASIKDSAAMDVKLQNANEVSPAKKVDKITLECVQNNSHTEDQEFSFVLRNYSEQGTSKEDAEKIVLHSICDALKSSLKLPPSGTRTLKVHLTVSPKSGKDTDVNQEVSTSESTIPCESLPCDEPRTPDTISKKLFHQPENKTASPQKTTPSKYPAFYAKCCQQEAITNLANNPLHDIHYDVFSSPHTRRHRLFTERKTARKWVDAGQLGKKDTFPNFRSTPQHSFSRERQQHHQTEQHFSTKDCNNYLDLADLKISDPKENQDKWDPRYLNPAYCSPRHLEKSRRLCHFQKPSQKKNNTNIHHKPHESELHSGLLKYKLLQKAKNNNLLDLSFDLCDVEDKVTDKPQYEHRRSRSYDTNNYSLVNSPNLRHKSCNCSKCVSHCDGIVPPSPGRHHRHCHRKREKDKLRAMEEVARWLDREDLNKQSRSPANSVAGSEKDGVVERHEYHHIHEHHHYYHYVQP